MSAVNELVQVQIINIDGKCLRGSDDKGIGKRAIYMVSAWASENEIVLGQRKVVVRRHWAIENELHWVLDVAMNEDYNRVHKDQAPENMAVLRHIAINLLKQEKTAKGGVHAKQLQAAWNNDYLCKILAAGI